MECKIPVARAEPCAGDEIVGLFEGGRAGWSIGHGSKWLAILPAQAAIPMPDCAPSAGTAASETAGPPANTNDLTDLGDGKWRSAAAWDRQSAAFRSQFVVHERKADRLFQRDAQPRRAHIAPDAFIHDGRAVFRGLGRGILHLEPYQFQAIGLLLSVTKGGIAHGKTDDYGYYGVEDQVHINDLHATMLNRFGVDHLKLTHRFQGRDYRLTDVGGKVIEDWFV